MKKHVMLCVLALALTLCVFAAAQAEGGQVSPLDNLPTAAPSQLSYNPATEEDGGVTDGLEGLLEREIGRAHV